MIWESVKFAVYTVCSFIVSIALVSLFSCDLPDMARLINAGLFMLLFSFFLGLYIHYMIALNEKK